ncbi:glycosyltransferase family 39 protein [Candidatus Dependentiae bacterium]|nr:glycosyltransferase family 39 protein [Candidatus Dependentiae bacterium]
MKKIPAKHLLALLSFLVVFLILGIPYTTIGFDSDCFGLVFFSAQIKNFYDLVLQLFKPIQSSYVALNELTTHAPEGFLTYFRPFMTLAHYICYQVFGFNPYAYHLVNVGLHALTTSTLVYLFSEFLNCWIAFLLGLAFAFHPALTPAYVGVTSHVVPGYLFWALMLLAYLKFLKTDQQRWHLLAAFLFLLSLLCYEIVIVFPVVLLLFLVIFKYDNIIKKSYLFLIAILSYLTTRYFLLGPAAAHEQKALALTSLPHKIILNWHQAIKPFWGLQNASKVTTITVMTTFFYFFFMIFFQTPERRRRFIFYVLSFFLLAWPISLVSPDGRYFYPAIPVFTLILYEMISHLAMLIDKSSRKDLFNLALYLKNGIALPFLLMHFIGWGIFHDRQALATRTFVTHQRDQAFQSIADHYKNIPDLRLIMIGTLHCYNSDTLLMQQGMTQAARLFFKNPELEAYHVTQAKIYSIQSTNCSFHIQQLANGFRFTSPLPEKLFFMIPHAWQQETPIPFSMGTIIVHKKSAPWKASDISFIFDETWLAASDLVRTKFVTFDLNLWSFVQLELGEKV